MHSYRTCIVILCCMIVWAFFIILLQHACQKIMYRLSITLDYIIYYIIRIMCNLITSS